jgi:hypothetical protein
VDLLEDIRRKASEAAARVLTNDAVRDAIDTAIETGRKVAVDLNQLGDEVRKQFEASTGVAEDDTRELKDALDLIRNADAE